MSEKCRDIMTPEPMSCLATDSAADAAKMMRNEDVGSLPVVSDQQRKGLVGIVTDRDLAMQIVAEGRDSARTQVRDVMTVDPIACRPDDDVRQVMDVMAREQIRRVPVVDEDNRVIGIIAQADIARRTEMPNKTGEVVERISEPNQAM